MRCPVALAWLSLFLGSTVLTGCGPAVPSDLQAWVQSERSATRPQTQPRTVPALVTPPVYAGAGLPDPFSPGRHLPAGLGTPASLPEGATRPAHASKRPRQPLEAIPLDSMVLVGTLESQGQRVAWVRVDQWLHPVRTGAYLGQHQGRVTRITEQGIELRETVQDASGAWRPRSTTLHIQEDTSR